MENHRKYGFNFHTTKRKDCMQPTYDLKTSSCLTVDYNVQTPDIELSITLKSDSLIKVKINVNNTVEELKEKIRSAVNIPMNETISLVCNGKRLENFCTLATCNITEESEICQLEETKSVTKANFGFEFPKLNDIQKLQIKQVRKGDLGYCEYLTICAGLNLKGTCVNSKCEAFNKVIYIKRHMGDFVIGDEIFDATCPMCSKAAEKVDNLGFFNCIYSFKGCQIKPERKKVDEKDQVADDKEFTTFKESGDNAHWTSLNISTRPRK